MGIFSVKPPVRFYANNIITDRKLSRYVEFRKRGAGIGSAAFSAYLPRKLGTECEKLAKERGLLP